ncbi:MAG TPA: hypothetical protein VF369_07460, partial [candidate division Zixibacteria bacterium]
MIKVKLRLFLITVFLFTVYPAVGRAQVTTAPAAAKVEQSDHILGSEEVKKLLTKPECFGSLGDTARTYLIKDYSISSKGISLSAQLYLPSDTGKWPLVILVPGGFNETELIMESPRYYASRLARCGIAAL